MKKLILLILIPLVCLPATEKLLFVGEDVEVLTAASRRPESPRKAPAVASVITSKELKEYGIRTIGEALSMVPGFYMAKREWGTQPYLRGVPEGILFLYDGVPLTSDSTKSVHPIDEEISPDSIERIEIVRGPGSVLWGPDAFVGIVNIVPKKKGSGFFLSTRLGSPFDERNISLRYGRSLGPWYVSLFLGGTWRDIEPKSYTVLRFMERGKVVPPEERFGSSSIGRAYFKEAVLSVTRGKGFEFLARLSDYKRPYVMTSHDGKLTWSGRREAPFSFVKVKLSKNFQGGSLDFNAYYNNLKFKKREIDLSQRQRNHIIHLELMGTKELFSKRAIVTAGVSYRKNWVRGATISQGGFLPDYLKPENKQFAPHPRSKDYHTDLRSAFIQYRHHFKALDIWAGIRFDDHSDYESTVSYNLGLGFFPSRRFYTKLILGTAYRTPYSAQMVGKTVKKPERVESITGEIFYKPFNWLSLSISPFYSRIKDHVAEDPFGGYSLPSEEHFLGVEPGFELRFSRFRLWGNALFLSKWGEKERYKVLSYLIIKPDGTYEEFYSQWEKPFDYGTDKILNCGFSLNFDRWSFSVKLNKTSDKTFSYLKGREHGKTGRSTLVDANLEFRLKDFSLDLSLKNAFGERKRVPGTYSPIKLDPTGFYVSLKARF